MSHQNSKGPKAFVHPYGPEKVEVKIKDPVDTMPSDYQPPGTDSEEYSSLEEALTS